MFETTEVRWFHEGKSWPEVEAWFRKGTMHARVEPFRMDYYLSMPLEEWLGIKVRDGKLEIKRCVHDDGVHSFSDRSFEGAGGDNPSRCSASPTR